MKNYPACRVKVATVMFFLSYRTMKENIGELLHELDQTRSGDKTWDHNQSFGLHKLLKIVDGESRLVGCTALTLCPLGNFSSFFSPSDFNQSLTAWTKIRPDILSG